MARAFTPGLTITRSAVVRRIRELPIPGSLPVKVGDVVRADQVVARTDLPGELHILRVAEKLGIEPAEVMEGIRVQVGDHLEPGQVVCEHSGFFRLFRSKYVTSVGGEVELITPRTGHVAVRGPSTPIEIAGYLSGKVVEVVDGQSVTIETRAALVQGIFGVGGERLGRLKILDVPPTHELGADDIPDNIRGAILVGGARPTIEALRRASELGAVGLIVGSIDDRALAAYLGYDLGIALTGDEEVPMTLIFTEGFGRIPMATRTLDILTKLDGREASINGATQVRAGAVRPEIVVCLGEDESQSSHPSQSSSGLEIGTSVRLIRVPYFGKLAKVVELPQRAERIETGAYTRVLRAQLEGGEIVTVPRANVEILEK